MVSEISKLANKGADLQALRSVNAPAHSNIAGSGIQKSSEGSKVQTPVHAAIKFDPNEIRRSLQEGVTLLNRQMESNQRGLTFAVDEVVGGPVVTVTSKETGEVVRQIPNEVVIRVAHNIEKLKGLLLNTSA